MRLTIVRVKAACAALAGVLSIAVGCGAERPPPATEGTYTPGPTTGGGDAGAKPPGCGTKDDGSYCDCIDVPLFSDPPNMYFILDRSGSMADDDKWEAVRATVGATLRGIGPRANFGAAAYPTIVAGGDNCGAGSEIMSVRPGDPPSNGVDGPTTLTLMKATQPGPFGGTPTSATLTSLLPKIQSYPGKTFVILATDGGPNCNKGITCDASQCIPNIEGYLTCSISSQSCCIDFPTSCLDAAATVQAVGRYANAGIPVYVVGLPGSGTYGALLDDMAVAGGTAGAASPKYFRVDTASQTQLLSTLKKVAAKIIATCEFKLKEAPFDPSLVNVYLDEVVTPQNGNWTLNGDTVTLVGSTCDRVLNGDVLDVRIITGCPTIIR